MENALPGWKLTMMLADSAQAVNGKLYILGGGWEFTGPQLTPSAIVLIVAVPWSETNRRHRLNLALVTDDGQPFNVPTPMGEQPLVIESEFEVGRPAGITPGSSINVPIALNIGPLQYTGSRYEWRCTINGSGRDDWKVAFQYRTQPQPPGM